MEELAQAKASLHKYENAEALMKEVLDIRIELWGEGSEQACNAERLLARCIPENRLLDRFELQREILDKYWLSKTLDLESSTTLLLDIADTCSTLGDFESEAAIQEWIIASRPYSSDRDQQYVWDVQNLSFAYHKLDQYEKVGEHLDLAELIRARFDVNLRDLAWTLQLLAMAKRALGKPEAAASILEQSLIAGSQNPTEKVIDNLERLDLLLNIKVELCRWQEAKNAWVNLLELREDAQMNDWPIYRWEKLKLIDEKMSSAE